MTMSDGYECSGLSLAHNEKILFRMPDKRTPHSSGLWRLLCNKWGLFLSGVWKFILLNHRYLSKNRSNFFNHEVCAYPILSEPDAIFSVLGTIGLVLTVSRLNSHMGKFISSGMEPALMISWSCTFLTESWGACFGKLWSALKFTFVRSGSTT